jgi:hypothetical protein
MAAAEGGIEYAKWALQANQMERKLHELLDELAARLSKASKPDEISQNAESLATSISQLALELDSLSPLEAAEKTSLISEFSERINNLVLALPDAMLVPLEEQLACEIESINSSLRMALADLESLSLPHLPAKERAKIEKSIKSRLAQCRRRIDGLEKILHENEHVLSHPLHSNLKRLHSAISLVQEGILSKSQEILIKKKQEEAEAAYNKMREFFCQQLAGRIYADAEVIQLRSDLSGRVAQFPLDDAHSLALQKLLGESSPIISRIQRGECSFSARFETRSADSSLHLLIEGGERTIGNDFISYSPQRIFRSI